MSTAAPCGSPACGARGPTRTISGRRRGTTSRRNGTSCRARACGSSPSIRSSRTARACGFGAYRAGTDGHYFWAGDDWAAFQARWQQLAAQGLRLVDVETYVDGGHRKFVGVWRAGTDGYTLWWGSDLENFLGEWNQVSKNGQRLVSLAAIDAPCQGDCCNHVVSRDKNNQPAPYVTDVTGDPAGPYRWPVDDNQYARVSALTFTGQPFTLPFKDTAVVHWGTWLYSAPPGNWHHAIDYLRPNDWKTFEAVAAAPEK